MELPRTRYARSGELAIAYQVFGSGEYELKGIPDRWALYSAE